MNRVLTIIGLAIVAIVTMPSTAGAANVMYDSIYYYITMDSYDAQYGIYGHAVVTNNGQPDCYSGDVVIPEDVTNRDGTYRVTIIDTNAFKNYTNLTSVTIPNTVTTIKDGAFSYCNSLEKVNMPAALSSIGQNAFEKCTSLTEITIPPSVPYISYGTFWGCSNLKSVTLPNTIAHIATHAFSGCASLTEITIPNSVTYLGYEAFSGCTSLTSVTIPDYVTYIDPNVFYDCTGLQSLVIGSAVTYIGYGAFKNCDNLTYVICKALTPPSMYNGNSAGATTFSDYTTPVLYVPSASTEAYKTTDFWNKFTTIKPIEDLFSGDVNCDGEITVADANTVVVIIINGGSNGHTRIPNPYGEGWISPGDINGDYEVNIADLNAIIARILSQQ